MTAVAWERLSVSSCNDKLIQKKHEEKKRMLSICSFGIKQSKILYLSICLAKISSIINESSDHTANSI